MNLQNLWTRKAEKQGAAPISFCNDVDDEVIPSIGPNFCYLEASYKLLSSTHLSFVRNDYSGCLLILPNFNIVRLMLGSHQMTFW